MIVASLPKISRQQGLCVYESEHLVYVADTLEHLRILQLSLAWGVPVTLGGAVIDCSIQRAQLGVMAAQRGLFVPRPLSQDRVPRSPHKYNLV